MSGIARRCLPVLAALAVLAAPGVAVADTLAPLDSAAVANAADRISSAWQSRQVSPGYFHDPFAGGDAPGYGSVMLGFGLIRAGVRSGNRSQIVAGMRAVDTETKRPPRTTGVFERLAFARTYNYARAHMPNDPEFEARRSAWAEYMATYGTPFHGLAALPCINDPTCFHNQEIVEGLADVELLATGITSHHKGTLLARRDNLRAAALKAIGVTAAQATGRTATSSGPGPTRGMGLLSDSHAFPLAYHALSALALTDSVRLLGPTAPVAARSAAKRAVDATAALLGPDGDIAYIGRRQEQSWALAAAVAAAQAGLAGLNPGAAPAGRWAALATRGFDRLIRVHGIGSWGIRVAPREDLSPSNYTRGIDVQNVNYNGLTAFLLDLAADVAPAAQPQPASLVADRDDGWFLDPVDGRFATVRTGNLWYVVHGHRGTSDARYDFGTMVLKKRENGTWTDILHPRPMTVSGTKSAGPAIEVHGRRWLPSPGRLKIVHGGGVDVSGGFVQDRDRSHSLGRKVTFHFRTVHDDGVRMSFRALRGDVVKLTTFLPASEERREPGTAVGDRRSIATMTPKPDKLTIDHGFSSCCDLDLVAATLQVKMRRSGAVGYTLRAR